LALGKNEKARTVPYSLTRLPGAAKSRGVPRRAAVTTSDQDKQRIAKEEETWNAPKLFVLGFVFLGACIALIMLLSHL
jgi:hypothetical protein